MITIHFQMGNAGCFRRSQRTVCLFLCVCPSGRTMFSLLFIYMWFIELSVFFFCGLNMWFYLNQYVYIYIH